MTSQGQTVWLRKKWSWSSKSAWQGQSAYCFWANSLLEFEFDFFSFKWPWPWIFVNVQLLFAAPNTLMPKFFNFSKNANFIGYGKFRNDLDLWTWPRIVLNVLLFLDETNTLVAEFFKSVHKQRFYRILCILTSQGQTVWPRKNGRYFRTQRAKGYLHIDFERNHSNLNPNTNTTPTLWTSVCK